MPSSGPLDHVHVNVCPILPCLIEQALSRHGILHIHRSIPTLCCDHWSLQPVPLFVIWNLNLIHASLNREIIYGRGSARTLISAIKYLRPLIHFTIQKISFFRACFPSEIALAHWSGFTLISAFHCLSPLTGFANTKLKYFLTSFSLWNHALLLIFFIVILDRWSTIPLYLIFTAVCLDLWKDLPP